MAKKSNVVSLSDTAPKARKPRKPLPKYFEADGVTERKENKAERFKRLGSDRVSKAAKAISVIGNLAGSGYEYTPEQVQAIRDILSGELETALGNFNRTGKAKRDYKVML